MTLQKGKRPVWFTLDFCPDAELVVVVRHFVDDFCNRILDMDNRGLLAVAIHELLENGVKHSADGRVNLHIEVSRTERSIAVLLETTNAANEADREAVQKLFEASAAAPNPDVFYQGMMLKPGPGGLGLARIMAEAGMRLDVKVDSENVCITGTVEFPVQESIHAN